MLGYVMLIIRIKYIKLAQLSVNIRYTPKVIIVT